MTDKMMLAAATVATLSLGAFASADVATLGSSNDTWIREGESYIGNGTDGALDSRYSFVPYIQFNLSGLSIDEISNATLSVNKVAAGRNDGISTERFAVYGLTNQEGNTLQIWDEQEDFDPTDATDGLDFRNVGAEWVDDATQNGIVRSRLFSLDAQDGANVTESVDNDEAIPETLTGPDLVAFLNQRVDDNGYVTFLIPVEIASPTNPTDGRGYGIASKENANATLAPTLTFEFTAVPEPTSLALLGLGGLGLLRRRRA